MVGDVAAPVGLDQLGPDVGGPDEQVGQVGPDTEGEDVRVLEQQQVVLVAPEQTVLERVGVLVADRPEPPDPERQSSISQSRVSMISRSRARKAAA